MTSRSQSAAYATRVTLIITAWACAALLPVIFLVVLYDRGPVPGTVGLIALLAVAVWSSAYWATRRGIGDA